MPPEEREFRLLELVLYTASAAQPRTISLDDHIVYVAGPVNTGKSTLVDAISFALGERAQWKRAAQLELTRVELRVRIQGLEVTLSRQTRDDGIIEILDDEGMVSERLPVRRRNRASQENLSDRLLDWTGLRDILDPGEARALDSSVEGFTFGQMWPYIHRSQGAMDQHVIMSDDRTRKELFELLLGLAEPMKQVLQVRLRECKRHRRQQKSELQAIKNHFEVVDAPLAHQVAEDRERTQRELAQATAELTEARAREKELLDTGAPLRNRLTSAHDDLARATARHGAACADAGRCNERLLALQRIDTSSSTHCPACHQELVRDVPPGRCQLCLQERPNGSGPESSGQRAAEVERAKAALADAERRVLAKAKLMSEAARRASEAETALKAYDEAELVALRRRITELGETRARLRERLVSLEQSQAHYRRWQDLEAGIHTAESEIGDLEQGLEDVQARVGRRHADLNSLDERFLTTVKKFGLPWFEGTAHMDRETYLPIVDGQKFGELGGGTLAAVNAAYSLALLAYSMQKPGVRLPQLLILDSPTKNIGGNSHDKELTQRILQYIVNLVRGPMGGMRSSRIPQVIVLDNDPPNVDGMNVIHLSREEPLLPGITHKATGEDPNLV